MAGSKSVGPASTGPWSPARPGCPGPGVATVVYYLLVTVGVAFGMATGAPRAAPMWWRHVPGTAPQLYSHREAPSPKACWEIVPRTLPQRMGRLLPFTSQELLLSFAAALRALAKGTGSTLLHGSHHHRIRTLAMFKGEDHGRKGVLSRPTLYHAQETFELLHSFLAAKVSDTLRHYCLRSFPPTTADPHLQRRWEAAAGSRQRKVLGRGA